MFDDERMKEITTKSPILCLLMYNVELIMANPVKGQATDASRMSSMPDILKRAETSWKRHVAVMSELAS